MTRREEIEAEVGRLRAALESISSCAVCLSITPASEHGEMLEFCFIEAERALGREPSLFQPNEASDDR